MAASVSIVLPFRDSEETIDECIQSIQAQELQNWELLAVNDNSCDNSESIVGKYAEQDSRINLLQSIDPGLVAALNLGVKHSATSLIARMDADDRMFPKRLDSQVGFMQKNPDTGLVSCQVEHYSSKIEDTRGYESYVKWTNEQLSHEQISLNRFVESPLAHPSVLFRKNLLDEFGPYRDGDFPEDYELWLRLLAGGVRMNKLGETLLKWRDHPARLSRKCQRYSKDAFQRIKARYLAMWLREHVQGDMEVRAWGAGKVARNQAKHLCREGVQLDRFFDVDPKKIGTPRPGLTVSPIEDIPEPGHIFLLVLSGARSARVKITQFLEEKEYSLGKDYLFVA